MESKKCNICSNIQPIENFNFRNKKNNKLHSSCKTCSKIARKFFYENNKDKTIIRNQKNLGNMRKWFKEFKSELFCQHCNESDPVCLEFHHINPKEKEHSISWMVFRFTKEKILKEIEKCIVLCGNCHRKHHYNEKNTKKKTKI